MLGVVKAEANMKKFLIFFYLWPAREFSGGLECHA